MLNGDQLDVNTNPNTEEYDTTKLNLPVDLYKQQKQVLGLMKKLESQRFININGTCVAFNVARLSTSFSFGNTYIILLLIKLSKGISPVIRHNYINHIRNSGLKKIMILTDNNINSSLIIVNEFRQENWVTHCKKLKLPYFNIRTKQDFLELCLAIINNTSLPDVVLLPYKKFNISLPHGFSANLKNNISTNIISLLSINFKWKRVITDNISFKKTDNKILSHITWLVTNVFNKSYNTYNRFDPMDIGNVMGKIQDYYRSNYIQSLVIRCNVNYDLPLIRQIEYFTPDENQIIVHCSTKGDVNKMLSGGKTLDMEEDRECVKCCSDITTGSDIYITTCCMILLCDCCIIARDTNRFINRCPKCSKIFSNRNLVYINKMTDLKSDIITKHNSKYEIIRLIMENNLRDIAYLENYTGIKLQSYGISEGSDYRRRTDDMERHVLIYPKSQFSPTDDAYKKYKNLTLITNLNQAYYYGPNITDLILLESISNKQILHALIGYLQRLGRTCSLTIHLFKSN